MKGMIKFYAPLAATSVLMMSSHSIVSTGLVRTAEANAALAAHAVAQSIAVLFAGPCYSMQRMGGRPVTRQELLQLSQARRVDVLDRTYGAHVACGLRISGQARFHGNTRRPGSPLPHRGQRPDAYCSDIFAPGAFPAD